ncbi:hypothetical protein D8M04_04480 [Oceanobacillus piezotolerans]|uniref:DUF3993 domain-containing protein n=1 Tax=Oceanobacillus piezotolerans TaxID=2448030 RepID=A0A498DA76_9BACI|nr:hypothetical protein [Oceanobacillus piezotolerans]RLL46468.1 hypothetical protein D8M04_04480 [Oceanobacillus piezotolerans]
MGKRLISLFGVMAVGVLIALIYLSNADSALVVNNHVKAQEKPLVGKQEIVKNSGSEEIPELTHEELIYAIEGFMNTLVQDIDENYKAVRFQTKDELLTEFEKVTTKEVAEPYVDFYYREEEDGIYMLPTETPPWFVKDNEYETEKIDEQRVKIIQNNNTVIDGAYTIELELAYSDGWKITDVTLI